jgi:hypothetical protein
VGEYASNSRNSAIITTTGTKTMIAFLNMIEG